VWAKFCLFLFLPALRSSWEFACLSVIHSSAASAPLVHAISTHARGTLGMFDNVDCATNSVNLKAGDILVLYTDGVTEAENSPGEEFVVNRLSALIDFLSIDTHPCLQRAPQGFPSSTSVPPS